MNGRSGPSERVSELAKGLLSGLFMAVRTARIHNEANRAFDNAVRTIHEANQALFAATGGYRIAFIGDTVLVNDGRLRLDGSTIAVVRTLRTSLEKKKIGGIGVETPPTFESSRALLELLRGDGDFDPEVAARANVVVIGPQTFADDQRQIQIDPSERAARLYAKLLIALRTYARRFEQDGDAASTADLRQVRLSRLVQDLVEVTVLAPRALLLLANHDADTWPVERHGANVCILAIALGHTLGLDRADLLDLGLTAALHHIGVDTLSQRPRLDDAAVERGFFRALREGGVGEASARRARALAHYRRPASYPGAPLVDLPARILGVCVSFQQLRSGFGLKRSARGQAVDVLALLSRDQTGRFDLEIVDLLVNVLRVFPVGAEVVLESGGRAVVSSHEGSRRWDRPMVVQLRPVRTNVDLMVRGERGFVDRIVGTARFLGAPSIDVPSSLPSAAAFPTAPTSMPPPGRLSDPTPATPMTADLDQIDAPSESLRKLPADAEALLKDFLEKD